MAEATIDQPAAIIRDTGVTTDLSQVAWKPCRFCEELIIQPVGRTKDFCSNKHRAAYREQEHQKALALAIEAVDNAEDVIEQAMAQLAGARAVLKRFQKKKTRK